MPEIRPTTFVPIGALERVPAAAPAAPEPPAAESLPAKGGRFIRNPKTGDLTPNTDQE